MGRLEGKIAVVTGGNSGIGKATAKLFAKEGAKVVIAARREAENQKVADEIAEQGGEACYICADLSSADECRKTVDFAIEKYGRIDVLVNDAGIADKHRPVKRCSEEWFDEVMKIDLYSVFWMCKYTLEYMEQQGKGSIVNISSIGAEGVSGAAYSCAKAAVSALTKNIACYYGHTDIRCNAVGPGPTPTPLNAPDQVATFDTEFADMCARHMDQSLPESQPEDQAQACLFFASDEAKSVNGQVLYVDHGTTLY